jgi:hypothetical protein
MNQKDKPAVLLEYYSKKLKLLTMLRQYAVKIPMCQKERTGFPTYLLRRAEKKLSNRETRPTDTRITEAHFPVFSTIATFDFKIRPSINEKLVRDPMRREYIGRKETALLMEAWPSQILIQLTPEHTITESSSVSLIQNPSERLCSVLHARVYDSAFSTRL